MLTPSDAARHRVVTQAVHSHPGPKIAMQILHGGRYSYHPLAAAPSALKAPIGWFTPREMSTGRVEATVADYGRAAALAMEAGYDGVEIMGSEGYLINQFIARRTNKRTDEWGGDVTGRFRLPVKIVEEVRRCTSKDFIIIFRLSMLDLVEGVSGKRPRLLPPCCAQMRPPLQPINPPHQHNPHISPTPSLPRSSANHPLGTALFPWPPLKTQALPLFT